MSTRAMSKTLRRRQLDRLLSENGSLRGAERPRRGWLYEIRNALGMSAAQLAARMGVRQSTVAKMERTEQEETISLKSLRRAAEAMDCELIYAFVPRQSLETTLEQQALRQALALVGRVEHTMALEEQALRQEAVTAEVRDLAAELVRTMSSELWRTEEAQ